MELGRGLRRAVVVVQHRGHLDALLDQAVVIIVEFVGADVDRDMVHRPVRRHETTLRRQRGGGRDAGDGFGRHGEPEKGETVAIADVEEEMLATPAGPVARRGTWQAEIISIEFERSEDTRVRQGCGSSSKTWGSP